MTADENTIVIVSGYVENSRQKEDTINLENDVLSQVLIQNMDSTKEDKIIIASKVKIVEMMRTAAQRKIEYNLDVLIGLKTVELALGERQIYLGRKATNDFVLKDESVSRIHAYIAYEQHRHILYDAGSLNGTFVNKKSISHHVLKDGTEF